MIIIAVVVFLIIWLGVYKTKPKTFWKSVRWTVFIMLIGFVLSALGIFPILPF